MSLIDWADPSTDLFGNSVDATIKTTNSDTLGSNWLDSVTGLLGSVSNAYATVKKADALNHFQTSPNGIDYINGQFSDGNGGFTISPAVLLIGGGVLLFLFLKK